MSPLQTTLISSLVGAGVAGVCTLAGILLNNWLTRTRERRQQLWRLEVDRIIDLEERAGQLVELACGYKPKVAESIKPQLDLLDRDAGKFLRHKSLANKIRDLSHFLSIVVADKIADRDARENVRRVYEAYDLLIAECDGVVGKRLI